MGSKTTLHTHTHAHTHSHTHVPTHIHTHTCSHTDTHSHADTDICSHSHEHAHTCSHKHAHTRTRAHTQQGGRLADRSRQHQPLTLDAHRWPASPDARFHSSDPHRPGASRSQTQKPTQSTQIHPHHQHQLSQIPSTHNTEHTETAGAQGPHPTFRYTASDSRTRTPTSRHIRPTHKATHPQPMNSRQRHTRPQPHIPDPGARLRTAHRCLPAPPPQEQVEGGGFLGLGGAVLSHCPQPGRVASALGGGRQGEGEVRESRKKL